MDPSGAGVDGDLAGWADASKKIGMTESKRGDAESAKDFAE